MVRTIARGGVHEIVVKKSRFIGSGGRAATEEEAREFVNDVKRQYWDASHNCSAWVLGERGEFQRSNDDGEPAGSAGLPMLNVLQRRDLTNTVVVVTRFFGGTLLGVGGLIRAYGGAVSGLIDEVGIVERQVRTMLTVTVDYDDAGRIDHALRGTSFHLLGVDYGVDVVFRMQLADGEVPEFENWLAHAGSGKYAAEIVGSKIVEVPIIDLSD